jgi:hypothetical protein
VLVQPCARLHAFRRQALPDEALEFVHPVMQRPDPFDNVCVARRRCPTVSRSGAHVVVADPRHSTSVAGVSTC